MKRCLLGMLWLTLLVGLASCSIEVGDSDHQSYRDNTGSDAVFQGKWILLGPNSSAPGEKDAATGQGWTAADSAFVDGFGGEWPSVVSMASGKLTCDRMPYGCFMRLIGADEFVMEGPFVASCEEIGYSSWSRVYRLTPSDYVFSCRKNGELCRVRVKFEPEAQLFYREDQEGIAFTLTISSVDDGTTTYDFSQRLVKEIYFF